MDCITFLVFLLLNLFVSNISLDSQTNKMKKKILLKFDWRILLSLFLFMYFPVFSLLVWSCLILSLLHSLLLYFPLIFFVIIASRCWLRLLSQQVLDLVLVPHLHLLLLQAQVLSLWQHMEVRVWWEFY